MDSVHVVAAIIERDGRIFAAHRTRGLSGAGWEFPGGRVEAGETSEQALRREVREELRCELGVMWPFDTVSYDYPSFHLDMDCLVCTLAPGQQPTLTEHDEARWLGRDELFALDWLPADLVVVRRLGAFWDEAFSSAHL